MTGLLGMENHHKFKFVWLYCIQSVLSGSTLMKFFKNQALGSIEGKTLCDFRVYTKGVRFTCGGWLSIFYKFNQVVNFWVRFVSHKRNEEKCKEKRKKSIICKSKTIFFSILFLT
ncbi:MAG: hypothetical protein DWP98_06775 [Bacteroidetes bacterium]|nr:MAG: hypothetical protein DWP98_06775 [Bacteroidota bacterium]